ncbi:hypothetical protein Droror1_Dr00008792 [Drosera rotundifolia]
MRVVVVEGERERDDGGELRVDCGDGGERVDRGCDGKKKKRGVEEERRRKIVERRKRTGELGMRLGLVENYNWAR